MTKFIKSCTLLLALLLLLTGCGAEAAPETTAPATAAAAQTTVPETTVATEPPMQTIYVEVRRETLDENGELKTVRVTTYNERGWEASWAILSPEGEKLNGQEYTFYDGYKETPRNDVTMERYYLREDGKPYKIEWITNEKTILAGEELYNDQGLCVEYVTYQSHTYYEYDEQGNRISLRYVRDGIEEITQYTNTYDDQGRLISVQTTVDGTVTECIEYVYEEKTLTETKTYQNDTGIRVKGDVLVTVTHYDDQGNPILIESRSDTKNYGHIVETQKITYETMQVPAA